MAPILEPHWYEEEHQLWFWGTGTRLNRFHPHMTDAMRAKFEGVRWTWDVSFEDMRAYREEAAYLHMVSALLGRSAIPSDVRRCAEGTIGWDWAKEETLKAIAYLRARYRLGQLSPYDIAMAEKLPGWTWCI